MCKIISNSSLSPKLCQGGVGISVVKAKCQPFPRMQHMEKEKAHNLITSPYKMKSYADLQNYVKLLFFAEYLSRWGGEICSKISTFSKKTTCVKEKGHIQAWNLGNWTILPRKIWMLRLTYTFSMFILCCWSLARSAGSATWNFRKVGSNLFSGCFGRLAMDSPTKKQS